MTFYFVLFYILYFILYILEPVWQSIRSPLFLLEQLFFMTCQLKLWYFAGTLVNVLDQIFDNDKASGTFNF